MVKITPNIDAVIEGINTMRLYEVKKCEKGVIQIERVHLDATMRTDLDTLLKIFNLIEAGQVLVKVGRSNEQSCFMGRDLDNIQQIVIKKRDHWGRVPNDKVLNKDEFIVGRMSASETVDLARLAEGIEKVLEQKGVDKNGKGKNWFDLNMTGSVAGNQANAVPAGKKKAVGKIKQTKSSQDPLMATNIRNKEASKKALREEEAENEEVRKERRDFHKLSEELDQKADEIRQKAIKHDIKQQRIVKKSKKSNA